MTHFYNNQFFQYFYLNPNYEKDVFSDKPLVISSAQRTKYSLSFLKEIFQFDIDFFLKLKIYILLALSLALRSTKVINNNIILF